MSIKIGINGFGRIGRMVLRAAVENFSDIEVALAPSGDTSIIATAPKPANGTNPAAPVPSPLNQPVGQLKDFLRDQESAYITRAVAQAGGDKEQAAKALGVSLATLYRKLAEGE